MCVCARTPYTDVCVSAHAYECAYSFLCVRVHARDDDALYFYIFVCACTAMMMMPCTESAGS